MSFTSIHDVGAALQTYLRSQKCPLDVIDGPEPTKTTTWGRERIVIEHDATAKASFDGPRQLHVNARHTYSAADPYKLTIYARSAKAGATEFEHRTRALLVREAVLTGLKYVAATNRNRFEPKSGAWSIPPDLATSETLAGAVYEISFTYEMPIRVVTFVGDAKPEGTLAGMTSTTKVSRAGVQDDDDNPNTPPLSAETACGA